MSAALLLRNNPKRKKSTTFAAQLHLPAHDLFWANLRVQLHLSPLDIAWNPVCNNNTWALPVFVEVSVDVKQHVYLLTKLLSHNQHVEGYKIQKQDFLVPFYSIIYYGLWCLFTETWLYSCSDQLPCKNKNKKTIKLCSTKFQFPTNLPLLFLLATDFILPVILIQFWAC